MLLYAFHTLFIRFLYTFIHFHMLSYAFYMLSYAFKCFYMLFHSEIVVTMFKKAKRPLKQTNVFLPTTPSYTNVRLSRCAAGKNVLFLGTYKWPPISLNPSNSRNQDFFLLLNFVLICLNACKMHCHAQCCFALALKLEERDVGREVLEDGKIHQIYVVNCRIW